MRRRDFVFTIGSAAPFCAAAWAQGLGHTRRVGVLVGFSEADEVARSWIAAFQKRLSEMGWNVGQEIEVQIRWADGNPEKQQLFAKELVGLNCDVIVAGSTPDVAALLRETKTIPIVFAASGDPVGSGFIESFARPGKNVTGISNHQASLAGKWLQLLKEVSPALTRVGVVFNPEMAAGRGSVYLEPIEMFAKSSALVAVPIPVRSTAEINVALSTFAGEPNGGIVVPPDPFVISQRNSITSAAERYRLPGVYSWESFVQAGGLLFYGSTVLEAYLLVASYCDRILKGEKPSEIPVQAPTKFKLVLNMKAAKAIGLTVPNHFLARIDEIIE